MKDLFNSSNEYSNIMYKLSMKYTTDKDLHNRVNDHFKNKGYNAIEDINDIVTQMPIILFDSNRSVDLQKHMSAREWLIERQTKK